MPPPTIKLRGACNLNKKSSPGCNALNGAAPGDQKLTSESSEFVRRWLNHSPSVTAMTSRTAIVDALWASECSTEILRLDSAPHHERGDREDNPRSEGDT